jgi:BirA family biotin operon repressor/biotin-[acetyl-CoA-carboxylase] ligase
MTPCEEWTLNTSRLGRPVLVFDRLDSTNTFALAHADDPSQDGLVVLADEQMAGRGQHGRTWTCPGGGGVLLSVLVFPPPALRRPSILTAWAAVSVCETILKTTGLEAIIKWPNDVLIQGRKVCGILIEQARGTVVGIGLNVNQPAQHFADAGLMQAASLAVFTRQTQLCRDVGRLLIQELDAAYEHLCQGDLTGLEASWKQRIGLLGKQVEADTCTGRHCGRLRQMSFDGLDLQLGDNTSLWMPPESVRHIWQ